MCMSKVSTEKVRTMNGKTKLLLPIGLLIIPNLFLILNEPVYEYFEKQWIDHCNKIKGCTYEQAVSQDNFETIIFNIFEYGFPISYLGLFAFYGYWYGYKLQKEQREEQVRDEVSH